MKKSTQKTNMEVLNEIRNMRNLELKQLNKNDSSVICVEFFGEGNQTKNKIFRLIEQQQFEDKPTINIEKFYIYENDKPKLVAAKLPDHLNEEEYQIVPMGIDGDKVKDWDIFKEDIQRCIEDKTKQLMEVAKELGIEVDEITSLSEIDLEQKIIEKEKENNFEDEKDIENEDVPQKIDSKKVNSISGNNSINLDAKVDAKGTSLRKELGLEQYTSIEIVYAHKLNDITDENGKKVKKENAKFGLIGRKPDGTCEKIPEEKLSMYRGQNTEFVGIKNPQEIDQSKDDCIFQVGKSNKRLVIRQEEYGMPEVYATRTTRDNEGNVGQKINNKNEGTTRTDVEVRQLFNSNKGINQIDKMNDEFRNHKENKATNEMRIQDVDGDKTTKSHIHEDEKGTIDNYAIEMVMKSGNVSRKEATRLLNEELKKESDINIAIENVIEDIDEQYRGNIENIRKETM